MKTPDEIRDLILRRNKAKKEMLDGLAKASKTIREWIVNGDRGKAFTIELPRNVQDLVKGVMGKAYNSHAITANSIIHSIKRHGINGDKIGQHSIGLRPKDLELMLYIMTAPDFVSKGSTDIYGRESVKFYKSLSNGEAVVVEKEYKNSPDDMESITMWAEKSFEARNAWQMPSLLKTSETAIPDTDIAKIRKDAEMAIENDVKFRFDFGLSESINASVKERKPDVELSHADVQHPKATRGLKI